MTDIVKFNLQPPVLDEEAKKMLAQFGETVPTNSRTNEPPTLWWSHKPAGWCVEESDVFECDSEKGWDLRPAPYADDFTGMWYNPEINVVVLGYREHWFKENEDGTQTRLAHYESGARRRVQYAALVHGLITKEHSFAIISTSRVSKSKELFNDISKVQADVNKVFKKPVPLWTVWMRIGAQRNPDGSVVYTKLPQGASVAPPRVLSVGYTKPEQWQKYAELSTIAQAWASEQDAVVPGQVVVIQ